MTQDRTQEALSTPERLERNNRYYDRFVSQVNARSEKRDFSLALDSFSSVVQRTHPVLDIGCGTGNHLEEFQKRGIDAIGVEPSPAMRDHATQRGFHVLDGSFETLDSLRLPKSGGIWCAASLLHVPEGLFEETLIKIHGLLVENGPLYFTVRLGRGAKWDHWDSESPDATRFIQLFEEDFLERALDASGFKLITKWIENSTWGRPSQWISLLAKRS